MSSSRIARYNACERYYIVSHTQNRTRAWTHLDRDTDELTRNSDTNACGGYYIDSQTHKPSLELKDRRALITIRKTDAVYRLPLARHTDLLRGTTEALKPDSWFLGSEVYCLRHSNCYSINLGVVYIANKEGLSQSQRNCKSNFGYDQEKGSPLKQKTIYSSYTNVWLDRTWSIE